ncbi:MAG: molybdopterin-dependent oxidoreductase [Dethiobacter sp.]|jgi:CO/xanthine dehydrogenase Mo-binding subunit|nr:molybdopterin-dependent oxidoreductase [Dethiobacter sp.]
MKKIGAGIASMWYGIGNTGLPNPASAFVEVLDDGTVIVLTGCADIGQGSSTVLAQIAAEEIGVGIEDVKVIAADTAVTPEAGATSASRQTYISGNAVRMAAAEAKKIIVETAAEMLNVTPAEIECRDKMLQVVSTSDKSRFLVDCKDSCRTNSVSLADCLGKCRMQGKLTLGHGWFNPDTIALNPETGAGSPYGTYAYATHIAEVEVDTETGEVTVLNLIAAHDVGKAINPMNVEGQIEGGCATGLGYALSEEVLLQEGKVLNPDLATYLIPTSLDIPRIYPIIVEEQDTTGPFGAKGVGEPALIPTAAAIANAVYNAVGVRITDLPITSEKVLASLKKTTKEE